VQQKESQSTNFTEVRQLRNAIEHWTADRNLEIFDQLMLDTVLNLESRFVAWVRCLPEKCHGVIDYDSRSVMEKLRTLVEKQYGVENTVKSESKHES